MSNRSFLMIVQRVTAHDLKAPSARLHAPFQDMITFSIMRTNVTRADAILHPQRMALIRALASRPQATKELAASLPDIPQATLYRHLSILLEVGIVRVTDERQVRGAVERTYALAGEALVSAEELAQAGADDHFRYFATFLGGLLGEFGSYLERTSPNGTAPDLASDGVGYRQHVLNLTDHELVDLLTEVRSAIAARTANELTPDRTARLIATTTIPLPHSRKNTND